MRLRITAALLTAAFTSWACATPAANGDATISLAPAGDAYVVADLADPDDRRALRKLKTGDLGFLRVWNASDVPGEPQARIVSLGYLRFDLADVEAGRLRSAHLRLHAEDVTLTASSRAVDVHTAVAPAWDEAALDYTTAPAFEVAPAATASVGQAGWYEWDVTEPVGRLAGSQLTFVVVLKQYVESGEELVLFASKEADDRTRAPSLQLDTAPGLPIGLPAGWFGLVGLAVGALVVIGAFLLVRRRRSRVAVPTRGPAASGSFCPHCGAAVGKGHRYCSSCGKPLEA